MKRNYKIEFNNFSQILGQGGPYIADLYIDKKFISDSVLADNYVVKNNIIVFSFFQLVSYFAINNFFSIIIFDLESSEFYNLDLKLNAIYLSSIDDEFNLTYFEAFNDKDIYLQRQISIKS